jgi:hypothetical protein
VTTFLALLAAVLPALVGWVWIEGYTTHGMRHRRLNAGNGALTTANRTSMWG